VLAGRSLGVFSIFFLGVAEYYSAASFLGMPGWAYQYGVPAFVLLMSPPLLWSIVYWLGPLIQEAGRQWGCLTQAQFFAVRFESPALGSLAAVIAVISLVPYIAIQMMASGYMFQVLTNDKIPYWLGSIIIYAVVACYTFVGGLESIRRVAILKGLFMLAVVIWLLLKLSSRLGGITGIFRQIANHHPAHLTLPGGENFMGYMFWSTTIVVGALGGSMYPHFFINFFSARSAKRIKLQAALSPLYLVLTFALVTIGFGGVLLRPGVVPSDHIIVEIIKTYMPYWLIGILCAAGLAAGSTTASAVLLAVAATISKDLIAVKWKKEITDNGMRWLIRSSILAVTCIAYLFALLRLSTIVYIAVALLGVSAQFFPLTIYALYSRRGPKTAAFLGLLTGTLVTIVFTLGPIKNPMGIHAGLIGLTANLLVFFTVCHFTRIDSKERTDNLLYPASCRWQWNGHSIFFVLGISSVLLLSIWPTISVVNRIQPYLFGLPLFVCYVLGVVAFSVVFLLGAYKKGV
jgi:SSS family solute:Na+ symporter